MQRYFQNFCRGVCFSSKPDFLGFAYLKYIYICILVEKKTFFFSDIPVGEGGGLKALADKYEYVFFLDLTIEIQ